MDAAKCTVCIEIFEASLLTVTNFLGFVRSFAMTHDDFLCTTLRSNKRYDFLMELKAMHEQIREMRPTGARKCLEFEQKKEEKGILGHCILRELSHFDVGFSFMADSLHNIYIGTFVSDLKMKFWKNFRLIILEKNDATLV